MWKLVRRKIVISLQITREILFHVGHYKHGDDAKLWNYIRSTCFGLYQSSIFRMKSTNIPTKSAVSSQVFFSQNKFSLQYWSRKRFFRLDIRATEIWVWDFCYRLIRHLASSSVSLTTLLQAATTSLHLQNTIYITFNFPTYAFFSATPINIYCASSC
jgi:hypothetical protein